MARSQLISLGSAPTELALSACELALALCLDPAEQCPVNHVQRSGHCSNSVLTLDQPDHFHLNLSVWHALGVLVICALPAQVESLSKGHVFQKQDHWPTNFGVAPANRAAFVLAGLSY